MKRLLLLPAIYVATASFMSFTVLVKPILKKIKGQKNNQESLRKYQKSFYISRR